LRTKDHAGWYLKPVENMTSLINASVKL